MNEYGISFVETLMTLLIMMLITGSLVPLHSRLDESLYNAKLELHASEVAYQGALQAARGEALNGMIKVEGVQYNWKLENNSVCVNFQTMREERKKCISA